MKGPDVKSILEKISNPQDIFMTQYECNAQAVIDSPGRSKTASALYSFQSCSGKGDSS